MDIETARKQVGLSRQQVSDWLGIPYRSLMGWARGESKCPDYVSRLIVEKLLREGEEYKQSLRSTKEKKTTAE